LSNPGKKELGSISLKKRNVVHDNGVEFNSEIHSGYKITVSGDSNSNSLTEVGSSVEGKFDSFDSKVGISSVNYLEKSDLRITGEIDILSTVSY